MLGGLAGWLKCVYSDIDGWTVGWKDGWIVGWIDGWLDG